MTDPQIIAVSDADGVDRYLFEEIQRGNSQWSKGRIPTEYADATVTIPEVADWVRGLVTMAVTERGVGDPVVRRGPSLLLTGLTGVGKTHEAYAAMRALSVSGVHCWWRVCHERDMFGLLRPRSGVDPEEEYENLARSGVLVIDDLGTEKRSEWTEGVLDRLVNHRYEWQQPTLVTSNVPPKDFSKHFGERVASRLVQMCRVVKLTGPDRRRGGAS